MPTGVVKIRKLLKHPDTSPDDISRAASTDPALATKLLRVANSVYHGSFNPCRDLRSAVVRLGSNTIEHVAMLYVVSQVFNVGARRQIQPLLKTLWQHSTQVATLSELLAEKFAHLKPDVAMLAGLTHDIGTLPVLVRAQKVPALMQNPHWLNRLVERLHCEIGQAMLQAWRFPAEFVSVVAGHSHLTRRSPEAVDYVDIVMIANLVSHAGEDNRLTAHDWQDVPAFNKLGLDAGELLALLEEAKANEAKLRDL